MRIRFSFALLSMLSLAGILFSTPVQAEQRCRAYTIKNSSPHGFKEVNNCPPIEPGTFQNRDWSISVFLWEPATYMYRGKNRHNGRSMELLDFDVSGTTHRPQYNFHNGNVTYRVTHRVSDQNTIRLEVFQGRSRILNQILKRTSNKVLCFTHRS